MFSVLGWIRWKKKYVYSCFLVDFAFSWILCRYRKNENTAEKKKGHTPHHSPIPNPQSPIPNPQSPIPNPQPSFVLKISLIFLMRMSLRVYSQSKNVMIDCIANICHHMVVFSHAERIHSFRLANCSKLNAIPRIRLTSFQR